METNKNITPQLRRRVSLIDRLIDALLPNMAVCDYYTEDQFVMGVIQEIRWLTFLEEYGINELELSDINEYISKYKYDDLAEYYNDHCGKKIQEQIKKIIREEVQKNENLIKGINKSGIFNFLKYSGINPNHLENMVNIKDLPKELLYDFMDDTVNNSASAWLSDFYDPPLMFTVDGIINEIQGFGGGYVYGEKFDKDGNFIKDFKSPYTELSDELLYRLFSMVLYGPYYLDIYKGEPY